MAESPRKVGKYGAVFMDIYDASHGPTQRIKIADVFNWELDERLTLEDCTIKGETAMRHKVSGYTATWRAERYVQGPSVFARDLLQYVTDPSGLLGAMGAGAGVDQGVEPLGANTLFGGESLTANGTGTGNKRPPVDFRLYVYEQSAAGSAVAAAAGALSGSAIYEGKGFLMTASLLVPRTGLMNDRVEVQVDGDLLYSVVP